MKSYMKNDKLIKLRESKMLSMNQLAHKAEVAWQTIKRAEIGLPIRRDSKIRIAQALQVPLRSIFRNENG